MLHESRPLRGVKPKILLVTPDAPFAREAHEALQRRGHLDLAVHGSGVETIGAELPLDDVSVLLVDLDDAGQEGLNALQRLLTRFPGSSCAVITRSFDAAVARSLLQLRVADFLNKPVSADELMDVCLRTLHGGSISEGKEADILTFLPAMGGVGCTTLAIQSAILLQGNGRRSRSSACLVDLNFQDGACAEYLDLEPRLDLKEIEPHPERLDRQLLEVMLSRHRSGLSVIAAPGRPGEIVRVAPETVSRLLDLAAAHFDHVVIDLPRNWFAWTDNVLMGSNRLFIVGEMTVPALRHARTLSSGISERLADAPAPQIIVNRFEQRAFGYGIRRSDIGKALGEAFAGTVANNYRLVREAIDQGLPISELKAKSNVVADLRRLVLPEDAAGEATGVPFLAFNRRRPAEDAGIEQNLLVPAGEAPTER